MDIKELINAALKARDRAYAPYSHFKVGAALLTESGRVYAGCNIENAAYSPTNCAERTAFFKAVSEGERNFIAIAITGDREDRKTPGIFSYPCGVCRQVMFEFCGEDFKIIVATDAAHYQMYTLGELAPHSFGKELQSGGDKG